MDVELTLDEKRMWLVDDISGVTSEDFQGLSPAQHEAALSEGWGEARLDAEDYVRRLAPGAVDREFTKRRDKGKSDHTRLADFGFWANFETWTFEEAVALSLGYEPSPGLFLWATRHRHVLPEAASVHLRSIVMQRRRQFDVTGHRVVPAELFAWLEVKQYPIPPGWRDASSEARGPTASQSGKVSDDEERLKRTEGALRSLERKHKCDLDNMRAIIAALAVKRGYDPARRSDAIGKMYRSVASELEKYGRTAPTEKTLRTYVNEGLGLLESPETDPRDVKAKRRRQSKVKPSS